MFRSAPGASKKNSLFFFFVFFSPFLPPRFSTLLGENPNTDNDVAGLRRGSGPHQLHRDVPARPRQAQDAARWRREPFGLFLGSEAASPYLRRRRPRRPLPGRSRRVLCGYHARVLQGGARGSDRVLHVRGVSRIIGGEPVACVSVEEKREENFGFFPLFPSLPFCRPLSLSARASQKKRIKKNERRCLISTLSTPLPEL